MLEDEARASEWLKGTSNVNDIHMLLGVVTNLSNVLELASNNYAYKFAAEENLF